MFVRSVASEQLKHTHTQKDLRFIVQTSAFYKNLKINHFDKMKVVNCLLQRDMKVHKGNKAQENLNCKKNYYFLRF